MAVLVTRPLQDQGQTLMALEALGLVGISAPALAVKFSPFDLEDRPYQGVIFTSRNGLRALTCRQIAQLLDLPVFCVGQKTASLARERGLKHIICAQKSLEGLVEQIEAQCSAVATCELLYITGKHRTGTLDKDLIARGYSVSLHQVYETVAVDGWEPIILDQIRDGVVRGVLSYSTRTSQIILDMIMRSGLGDHARDLRFYCLSEAVARPFAEADYALVVAKEPNEAALLASVKNDHNYLR